MPNLQDLTGVTGEFGGGATGQWPPQPTPRPAYGMEIPGVTPLIKGGEQSLMDLYNNPEIQEIIQFLKSPGSSPGTP